VQQFLKRNNYDYLAAIMDLLIAGVAASRGLKVVTNNTGHFERIADIALENWLRSS
jgi:predicted nucleic acid-binding protein